MPAYRVAFAVQLSAQPALAIAASMGSKDMLGGQLPGSKRWLGRRRAFAPRVVAAGTDSQQAALLTHCPVGSV